jgi:alkanesulfonate monooxygenase SsuD/methylene tetrahydromethanopterin reductase-like flavin-dependent oxidoreductase (luciferase family)
MNGIKFGIVAPAGEEPRRLIDFIRRAEEAGFDSFWAGDHMVFLSTNRAFDVISIIGAAGIVTEHITMCAITDPHKLHPAVLAQRISTVDHLTSGRFIACLGVGEAMNLDPYGIPWNKPLSRLREAVGIVRMLWESGTPFDHEGEFYHLRGALLGAKPIRGFAPIFIAAHREKSLNMAAVLGDGWLTLPQPPSLFAKKSNLIERRREESQERREPFEKCIYLFASIASSREESIKTLEGLKELIIWPELFEEAYGVNIPPERKRYGFMNALPAHEKERKEMRKLAEIYSKEAICDFTVSGTPGDCIGKIEQYIEAGATHIVIHDLSPDRKYSFEALANKIIPYFKRS